MSKEAVIKARGEEFDAALRLERARLSVEQMSKLLEGARKEYGEAGDALRAVRNSTAALESSAVAEVARKGLPEVSVEPVRLPRDAVDAFDKARES